MIKKNNLTVKKARENLIKESIKRQKSKKLELPNFK
jgi:hypothetical protein